MLFSSIQLTFRLLFKAEPERSSVIHEAVEAANRAGKAALKQLLTEFPD
jgi:hypothetical protein